MAFCPNCGSKLTDDAKFCPECGTKVEGPPSAPADEPLFTPPTLSGSNDTYSAPADAGTNPPSGTPEDTGSYTPPYTPTDAGTYTYTPAAQNPGTTGTYTQPAQRSTYSYDPAVGSSGTTPPAYTRRDIPGGSQPPKKKTAILPIILIILGVAAVAVTLLGIFGGGDDADDPNLGLYVASYGTYAGSRVEIEDMWADGFSIELCADGKCKVTVNGESETWRYSIDRDGEIEIKAGGDEFEGTIFNGVLTLEDVMDSNVDIVFVREGAAANTGSPTTVRADYSWWNGDWYGWWAIYEGGGTFAEYEGIASDTCATIRVSGKTGLMDIWDDTCEEGTNIGYIDLTFEPGTTDKGCMVSKSGNFYEQTVEKRDWVVDPGDSYVSRFDSMITFDGYVYDPDNSDNWFHYVVFLRPWGMSWEDVRSDSCDDMPYKDMMPVGYDDWYVPHMNGSMPEYIDLYF